MVGEGVDVDIMSRGFGDSIWTRSILSSQYDYIP